MPRHHVNRVRAFNLLLKEEDANLTPQTRQQSHLRWEWFSAYLYVLGGAFLIIGSILFLPQYSHYVADGSYLFVVASVLYLCVSLHDLAEIGRATTFFPKNVETTRDDWLEVTAGVSYALGAALFIVGSVLFLPSIEQDFSAAICFILGSCLFTIGACGNVVQTYDSPDKLSMQYGNLEAVAFVAGSCVYVCASVPYSYDFESEADGTLIMEMSAVLYIVGSSLFLVGGIINIFRLLTVHDFFMGSLAAEVEPLKTNDTLEEEGEDVEMDKYASFESAREGPMDNASQQMIVSESIMKGRLARVPSAEDLLFGDDPEGEMNESIVSQSLASSRVASNQVEMDESVFAPSVATFESIEVESIISQSIATFDNNDVEHYGFEAVHCQAGTSGNKGEC